MLKIRMFKTIRMLKIRMFKNTYVKKKRMFKKKRMLKNTEAGSRKPAAGIICQLDHANYRKRFFKKACADAEIGARRIKDLRDKFASQLLTAGVQLGYVSAQLGHADVAVTARHYAKWVGGDIYREPMMLESGEVPADYLARLAADETPVSLPSPAEFPTR